MKSRQNSSDCKEEQIDNLRPPSIAHHKPTFRHSITPCTWKEMGWQEKQLLKFFTNPRCHLLSREPHCTHEEVSLHIGFMDYFTKTGVIDWPKFTCSLWYMQRVFFPPFFVLMPSGATNFPVHSRFTTHNRLLYHVVIWGRTTEYSTLLYGFKKKMNSQFHWFQPGFTLINDCIYISAHKPYLVFLREYNYLSMWLVT